MTINVTQEHIDRGVRCESQACPIVLAIRDVIGPMYWVTVSPFRAFVTSTQTGRTQTLNLPSEASAFVCDYDNDWHEAPQPFSFELPLKVEEEVQNVSV